MKANTLYTLLFALFLCAVAADTFGSAVDFPESDNEAAEAVRKDLRLEDMLEDGETMFGDLFKLDGDDDEFELPEEIFDE